MQSIFSKIWDSEDKRYGLYLKAFLKYVHRFITRFLQIGFDLFKIISKKLNNSIKIGNFTH